MDQVQAVKTWIREIVIEHNFCPFAAKSFLNERIAYWLLDSSRLDKQLTGLARAFEEMDIDENLETGILILPKGLEDFEEYLGLLDLGQTLLEDSGYEGTYQLASFHPDYQFAGTKPEDASNYTNRAPFPLIHILRESSLENALSSYPDPESIPERNIQKAEELGAAFFQDLLQKLSN